MAKQARKVALISVHDYNGLDYSAYYEIRIMQGHDDERKSVEGFVWGARIYSRGQNSKLIDEAVDVADTRDDADTAAQKWVLERMKPYKRTDEERVGILEARITRAVALNDKALAQAAHDKLKEIKPDHPLFKKQGGYATVGLLLSPLDAIAELILWLLRPLLALAYSTVVRNERLQRVQINVDLGAGAGLWRLYNASQPATCGSATTLLAELTFTDPCAPSASGGVLTFSAITADSDANASGTAVWFRMVDSTGTCCVDGTVGTSGADLNLNSNVITIHQQVSITSAAITEGNP